jgi:hypothetical protein
MNGGLFAKYFRKLIVFFLLVSINKKFITNKYRLESRSLQTTNLMRKICRN